MSLAAPDSSEAACAGDTSYEATAPRRSAPTANQEKAEDQVKLTLSRKMVDEWKAEVFESKPGEAKGMEIQILPKRSNPLVLRGPTQLGKTNFAESMFSGSSSLTNQRDGLGKEMPSLREFCPDTCKCIVFDEDEVNKSMA